MFTSYQMLIFKKLKLRNGFSFGVVGLGNLKEPQTLTVTFNIVG